MLKTRFIFIAIAFLAACATAPTSGGPANPEPVDPSALQIDIGRLGVMLSHVEDLTQSSPTPDVNYESPRELARSLRETVWEFNLVKSRLCARQLYVEHTCTPAFHADYLHDAPSVEPPLELTQERAGVVRVRIQQLWDAVCADARQRQGVSVSDRVEVCAIE